MAKSELTLESKVIAIGAIAAASYFGGVATSEPVRNYFNQKPQVRVEQINKAKASGQVSTGACEPKPASCTIDEATKVIKENMATSSGTFSWDGDNFSMPKIYFKRDANNLKNAFACEELIVKEKKVIPVFKQKQEVTIPAVNVQKNVEQNQNTTQTGETQGKNSPVQQGSNESQVNINGNNNNVETNQTNVNQNVVNETTIINPAPTTAPTEQPQPTPVPTRGEKPSTATGPNGEIIDLVPTDRP